MTRKNRALRRTVRAHEPHTVARPELTDLPEFRRDNRHRTDETAETGTVGAENDRHVAGEVEGTERVRVVVNIRRMQSRFAAVSARPSRTRSDQTHAGARGIIMDFVIGLKDRIDIFRRKKLRRAVRSIQHADAPHRRLCFADRIHLRVRAVQNFGGEHRTLRGINAAAVEFAERARVAFRDAQNVADRERPARVTAEFAEGKRRTTAEIRRDVKPALHQQIRTLPRTGRASRERADF